MLECVVNISEGQNPELLATFRQACGDALLDVHTDPDHNRSVFTLVGEEAPRALAKAVVSHLDIREHAGVHPRIGLVDVVPFVPLGGSSEQDALNARDRYARWSADELGVPCFLYGPERTLPAVRKGAFLELAPDFGPQEPHETAGATAVGSRPPLIAYNLWLADAPLAEARRIASKVRSGSVRALGLQVGEAVQVSFNLIDFTETNPARIWDSVSREAAISHAELVGLIPDAALQAIPPQRWAELDLSMDKTIEARLKASGYAQN